MKGVGQFLPSVTQTSLVHSCNTSQLSLITHHPHVNSDPSMDARHSEHPLAKSRQSYRVTVCVYRGRVVSIIIMPQFPRAQVRYTVCRKLAGYSTVVAARWKKEATPSVEDLGILKGGFQGSERVKDCKFY